MFYIRRTIKTVFMRFDPTPYASIRSIKSNDKRCVGDRNLLPLIWMKSRLFCIHFYAMLIIEPLIVGRVTSPKQYWAIYVGCSNNDSFVIIVIEKCLWNNSRRSKILILNDLKNYSNNKFSWLLFLSICDIILEKQTSKLNIKIVWLLKVLFSYII